METAWNAAYLSAPPMLSYLLSFTPPLYSDDSKKNNASVTKQIAQNTKHTKKRNSEFTNTFLILPVTIW